MQDGAVVNHFFCLFLSYDFFSAAPSNWSFFLPFLLFELGPQVGIGLNAHAHTHKLLLNDKKP